MFDYLINTKTINAFTKDAIDPIRKMAVIEVIHLDLIAIEKLNPKIKPEYSLNNLDWVVVSSINGLIHCPKKILKQLRTNQSPIAAVGKTTADHAKAMGLNLKQISQSSNISGFINAKAINQGQNYLFLKGKAGNQSLIEHLTKKNKSLQILEVYQRKEKTIPKELIAELIDKSTLWIFYSQSALISAYNNFKNDQLKLNWLLNQTMITFSHAISQRAKQIGFKGKIETIDTINQQLMNQRIIQLINPKSSQC